MAQPPQPGVPVKELKPVQKQDDRVKLRKAAAYNVEKNAALGLYPISTGILAYVRNVVGLQWNKGPWLVNEHGRVQNGVFVPMFALAIFQAHIVTNGFAEVGHGNKNKIAALQFCLDEPEYAELIEGLHRMGGGSGVGEVIARDFKGGRYVGKW
ncbi:MAG: hypothetical protein A2139_06940 [Desulfobacca sp. RBG_16_60_12]|nr:MAG: hypothetical protein A2139_06940 [Desulfobacca sp. RBG_16_60_12]OHD23824.1 MAG: hypothetical protein A2Y38_17190 [Spirochaetes bacterium GWB1_59_5]